MITNRLGLHPAQCSNLPSKLPQSTKDTMKARLTSQ